MNITHSDERSFSKYLAEVSKTRTIQADQEVALGKRIKKGDTKAIEELCVANLRFVISIAKRYQYLGLKLPDLISEGNIGLIEAARRFDETRGFKFTTYAVNWIRKSILEALSEKTRTIRLPAHQAKLNHGLRKSFAALEQEHERPPTEFELADHANLPVNYAKDYLGKSGSCLSLESSLNQSDDLALVDILPDTGSMVPEETCEKRDRLRSAVSLIRLLPPKEKFILVLWLGIEREHPLTHGEIAHELKMTKECVRVTCNRAIGRIQESMATLRTLPDDHLLN